MGTGQGAGNSWVVPYWGHQQPILSHWGHQKLVLSHWGHQQPVLPRGPAHLGLAERSGQCHVLMPHPRVPLAEWPAGHRALYMHAKSKV